VGTPAAVDHEDDGAQQSGSGCGGDERTARARGGRSVAGRCRRGRCGRRVGRGDGDDGVTEASSPPAIALGARASTTTAGDAPNTVR
jgi:hypothetical protein